MDVYFCSVKKKKMSRLVVNIILSILILRKP